MNEEPRMSAVELEALMDAILSSDNIISRSETIALYDWATLEARRQGYEDWADAMLKIGPIAEEERQAQGQFGVGA